MGCLQSKTSHVQSPEEESVQAEEKPDLGISFGFGFHLVRFDEDFFSFLICVFDLVFFCMESVR